MRIEAGVLFDISLFKPANDNGRLCPRCSGPLKRPDHVSPETICPDCLMKTCSTEAVRKSERIRLAREVDRLCCECPASDPLPVARGSSRCVKHANANMQRYRTFRYGVPPEELERILADQGNSCAVCDVPISLERGGGAVIDHDHACCELKTQNDRACGSCVRSVLCMGCNLAVGCVEKGRWSINVPPRITRYLERWQETLRIRALRASA